MKSSSFSDDSDESLSALSPTETTISSYSSSGKQAQTLISPTSPPTFSPFISSPNKWEITIQVHLSKLEAILLSTLPLTSMPASNIDRTSLSLTSTTNQLVDHRGGFEYMESNIKKLKIIAEALINEIIKYYKILSHDSFQRLLDELNNRIEYYLSSLISPSPQELYGRKRFAALIIIEKFINTAPSEILCPQRLLYYSKILHKLLPLLHRCHPSDIVTNYPSSERELKLISKIIGSILRRGQNSFFQDDLLLIEKSSSTIATSSTFLTDNMILLVTRCNLIFLRELLIHVGDQEFISSCNAISAIIIRFFSLFHECHSSGDSGSGSGSGSGGSSGDTTTTNSTEANLLLKLQNSFFIRIKEIDIPFDWNSFFELSKRSGDSWFSSEVGLKMLNNVLEHHQIDAEECSWFLERNIKSASSSSSSSSSLSNELIIRILSLHHRKDFQPFYNTFIGSLTNIKVTPSVDGIQSLEQGIKLLLYKEGADLEDQIIAYIEHLLRLPFLAPSLKRATYSLLGTFLKNFHVFDWSKRYLFSLLLESITREGVGSGDSINCSNQKDEEGLVINDSLFRCFDIFLLLEVESSQKKDIMILVIQKVVFRHIIAFLATSINGINNGDLRNIFYSLDSLKRICLLGDRMLSEEIKIALSNQSFLIGGSNDALIDESSLNTLLSLLKQCCSFSCSYSHTNTAALPTTSITNNHSRLSKAVLDTIFTFLKRQREPKLLIVSHLLQHLSETINDQDGDSTSKLTIIEGLSFDANLLPFLGDIKAFHLLVDILLSSSRSSIATSTSLSSSVLQVKKVCLCLLGKIHLKTPKYNGILFPKLKIILRKMLSHLNSGSAGSAGGAAGGGGSQNQLLMEHYIELLDSFVYSFPTSFIGPAWTLEIANSIAPLLEGRSAITTQTQTTTNSMLQSISLSIFHNLITRHPFLFAKDGWSLFLLNNAWNLFLKDGSNSSRRRLSLLSFLNTLLGGASLGSRKGIPRDRWISLLEDVNLHCLSKEPVRPVRNEAIRLIGIIGAIEVGSSSSGALNDCIKEHDDYNDYNDDDDLEDDNATEASGNNLSPTLNNILTRAANATSNGGFSESIGKSSRPPSLLAMLEDGSLSKLALYPQTSAIGSLVGLLSCAPNYCSVNLGNRLKALMTILKIANDYQDSTTSPSVFSDRVLKVILDNLYQGPLKRLLRFIETSRTATIIAKDLLVMNVELCNVAVFMEGLQDLIETVGRHIKRHSSEIEQYISSVWPLLHELIEFFGVYQSQFYDSDDYNVGGVGVGSAVDHDEIDDPINTNNYMNLNVEDHHRHPSSASNTSSFSSTSTTSSQTMMSTTTIATTSSSVSTSLSTSLLQSPQTDSASMRTFIPLLLGMRRHLIASITVLAENVGGEQSFPSLKNFIPLLIRLIRKDNVHLLSDVFIVSVLEAINALLPYDDDGGDAASDLVDIISCVLDGFGSIGGIGNNNHNNNNNNNNSTRAIVEKERNNLLRSIIRILTFLPGDMDLFFLCKKISYVVSDDLLREFDHLLSLYCCYSSSNGASGSGDNINQINPKIPRSSLPQSTGTLSFYKIEEQEQTEYYYYKQTQRQRQQKTPTPTTTPPSLSKGKIDLLLRAPFEEAEIDLEFWTTWICSFQKALLQESPSTSLRICATLNDAVLDRSLFNVAFVSCWCALDGDVGGAGSGSGSGLNSPNAGINGDINIINNGPNDFSERESLIRRIESILSLPSCPSFVIMLFISLLEWMDKDDDDSYASLLEAPILSSLALRSHSWESALRYEEMEYRRSTSPSLTSVQGIIAINSKIDISDAAMGIILDAKTRHSIVIEDEEALFEGMGRWAEALERYKERSGSGSDSDSRASMLGCMRCWHALGDWDSIISQVEKEPCLFGEVAPLACNAAWSSSRWDKMEEFVGRMMMVTGGAGNAGVSVGSLFRAVLAIVKKEKGFEDEAERLIIQTREALDPDLTTTLADGYSNRSYPSVIRAQMLSELEEVITLLKSAPSGSSEVSKRIFSNWSERLGECQEKIDIWSKLGKIRKLAPLEGPEPLLRMASLARKSQRPLISKQILEDLLERWPLDPLIRYNWLKHSWEVGGFTSSVQLSVSTSTSTNTNTTNTNTTTSEEETIKEMKLFSHSLLKDEKHEKLLSRCYYRLGCWQKKIATTAASIGSQSYSLLKRSLEDYLSSTSYDRNWAKAWHGWALANWDMAIAFETSKSQKIKEALSGSSGSGPSSMINVSEQEPLPGRRRVPVAPGSGGGSPNLEKIKSNPYLIPAIQGFFKAISLGSSRRKDTLQDSLRLLTLWFRYGPSYAEVNAAMGDNIPTVPIHCWLQVIPQLIARINVPSPPVRRLVHVLLDQIGREHPQALLCPLTVAGKSQSQGRRTNALAILERMKSHSLRLVEQAILLSQELIRVAILWEEQWYEGLEEASRVYFGGDDRNAMGMLSILEPLHQQLERAIFISESIGAAEFSGSVATNTSSTSTPNTTTTPTLTEREWSFISLYGKDLSKAWDLCLRYRKIGVEEELRKAWDIYYTVFRKIGKQLPNLLLLHLPSVCPRLIRNVSEFDLAVPGTYRATPDGKGQLIRLRGLGLVVRVIASKQRPRRIKMLGCNGRSFHFLLKGHEDLRQDERVMQLFSLVNTLLSNDGRCRKRNLSLQRFSVVPLSQNIGLIGWVPECHTLHELIKANRDGTSIPLSLEHRMIMQFAPDYDSLPLLGKKEAFLSCLEGHDSSDLARILWKCSPTSQEWLKRRLSFTRSLAVAGMAGYILGLGDRHPSNIMLDNVSGQIVLIDFGDCFEVAQQRDRFPERVPFRLTRMLERAMEASGVEGTFRQSCQETMRVLRTNKDSLMAILEAFVYDPLINWRLLAVKSRSSSPSSPTIGCSAANVAADIQYGTTAVRNTMIRWASDIDGSSAADGSDYVTSPTNDNNNNNSNNNNNMFSFSTSKRYRLEGEIGRMEEESVKRPDAINAGALTVITRVNSKLTGRDFACLSDYFPGSPSQTVPLGVDEQVDRLIKEATSIDNLCQAYVGWCAFW